MLTSAIECEMSAVELVGVYVKGTLPCMAGEDDLLPYGESAPE